MSKTLTDFLTPVGDITEEIAVSDRFPEPFVIRAVSKEEHNKITQKLNRGGDIDPYKLELEMIVAGTVSPDFADAELCKRCGTLDPSEAAGKVLLAGEAHTLSQKIYRISGFDVQKLEQDAKN